MICRLLRALIVMLLAASLVAGPVHAQNIVQDPSFETPAVATYSTYSAGQTFGSWTVGSGSVDLCHTDWQQVDGLQSVDTSGSAAGTLYQDLPTTAGKTYNLIFSLAGNPDDGTVKSLSVFWNGTEVPGSPFLFDTAHTNRQNMGWIDVPVSGLTATSSLTRLTFQSNNNSLYGPVIDNVRVTIASAPARFDFNGDGHNDLLWHNTATGQALVWDMNDQSVLAAGSPFTTVSPQWTIAAVADVNGDGHPDLLWENTSTGQLLFWLMGGASGTTVTTYGTPFATVKDTHWHVVSMADFNFDGHPDLLWENSATGQLLVWYMNGTTVATYAQPFATVSNTAWQVAGTADFDGDGNIDLLWHNSQTGQVLVWYLSDNTGTVVFTYGAPFAAISNTAWQIVGTGDTNGDSHPDIVWQNRSTGQVLRWLMGGTAGAQVQQYGTPFATVSDTHWQVVGVR